MTTSQIIEHCRRTDTRWPPVEKDFAAKLERLKAKHATDKTHWGPSVITREILLDWITNQKIVLMMPRYKVFSKITF